MNSLDFYNKNAELYFEQTHSMERYRNTVEKQLQHFLSLLPENAYILDFGCGSGRDSKYLLEHNCKVRPVDGSPEMCRLASNFIGQPVEQMLFSELDDKSKYDGIWASASILHVTLKELPIILTKMLRTLKPGGLIYTSFKVGDGVHTKEGKTYIYITPEKLGELLAKLPQKAEIIDFNTNISPKRSKSGENHWGNYFIQKT